MKKIAKYFFAALASAAAISCVQEMNVVEKPSVELTGDSYVFTATIGADTKTVLDEETMTPMWLGGEDGNEYITVMDKNSVNTYVAENITEPTRSVEFVMAEDGGPGLTDKEVVAVSPRGDWKFVTAETKVAKTVTTTVSYPASQYSTEGSYDPAAPVAVAYNPDVTASTDLHFNNVSALLKFQIHGDSDPVRSVKIYALGGEALAGTMNVTMTFEKEQEGEETEGEEAEEEEEEEKDFISVVAAEGASDCVELVEYTGMELEKDVTYYIAVAPAVLKEGIGIQFNNNEVQTLTISKEVVLERSKIYDLGVFSYDNEMDDKWYLIGNFTEGNDNSVGKHEFEAAGDNLLAVKKVTIKEGQEFKIYNPGKGLTLVANAEGALETGNWVAIDEGEGFMTAPAGEYDIYIDNFNETYLLNDQENWGETITKEVEIITGVALVSAGKDAPEFLSPIEGKQFTWFDEDYECTKIIDFGATESGVMYIGQNYDERNAKIPDPCLVGNWIMEGSVFSNLQIKSYATAGEVTMETVQTSPWGDKMSVRYILQYSNPTESSIDIVSSGQNERYVTDENGDPVLDDYDEMLYYSSFGIGTYVDWQTLAPLTMKLVETQQSIVMPVPDENLSLLAICFDDTYSVQYRKYIEIDLENSNLLIADNYDLTEEVPAEYDYETWEEIVPAYSYPWPREEMHTNKWFVRAEYTIVDYVVVPSTADAGQIMITATDNDNETRYFMINYSGYTYGSQIGLDSMEYSIDELMIPVEGVAGAYWEALGISAYGFDCELEGVDPAKFEFVDEYPATPDLAQWALKWEAMGEVAMVFDFGCFEESNYYGGYDPNVMGPDIPEDWKDKFITYFGPGEYTITPDSDDPASGTIKLSVVDPFSGETLEQEGSYAGYNGGMMYLTMEFAGIENVPAVLVKNAKFMPDPFAIGGTN